MNLEDYKNTNFKKDIKKLYISAFPKNERIPFFLYRKKSTKKNSHLMAITDRNKFIGFVSLETYLDITCIMYFAIAEDYRKKGYGTKALTQIKNINKAQRIVLIIEKEDDTLRDNQIRIKRRKFYEKNGFLKNNFIVKEGGVSFLPLSRNGKISKNEYHNLSIQFYGKILYKILTKNKKR